jgi:hypothetical protein
LHARNVSTALNFVKYNLNKVKYQELNVCDIE